MTSEPANGSGRVTQSQDAQDTLTTRQGHPLVDNQNVRPVGRMVLDRNPVNSFAEVEQAAFGTGVLVDGLDFSDDKMLQGRTLSYSDTHRHRVGANYLQLPINRPQREVNTNQRDGTMTYYVDGADSGTNPHVNYEPNSLGGVKQAPRTAPRRSRSWRAA